MFAGALISPTDNFVCSACHNPAIYEREFQRSFDLCDSCCKVVANEWHHWHSGRYLTWETPSSDEPRKKPIPADLRWLVFRRDDFRCVRCGSQSDLTADHIHPECLGGPTEQANQVLQLAERTAAMSVLLMGMVFKNAALNASEKLVMLAICDAANEDNYCWPSLERLAKRTSH